MKNTLVILTLGFIILGMVFNAPFLIANHGNAPIGTGSVSHNSDSSGSGSGDDDDDEDKDEDDDTSDDEDRSGKRQRDEIKEIFRERDGRIEREFERKFVDAEGNEIEIKRKIKIRNGEVEIETELEVEGEGSNLSVEDSTGRKHRIKVTPNKIESFVKERLKAENVTNFSLDEIRHENIPRVVFKVNSEHPGKFLGIFKLKLKAETSIDPETGEVLDVNVPWWIAFVTAEIPDNDEIVGNQTIANETVADDDELEEEFGDVEIEDDIETEVEISGDIELSDEAQTTLNALVSSFEGQEGKTELKLKVEKEDNETEIEQEIKEGSLTSEQTDLWNTLSEQVQALVESAEEEDVEVEIEIEHELEVEDETEQITVELTKENDSGESGTAMLVEENGQVTVTTNMIGFTQDVSQPAHIHIGSCPDVEGIKYPLTNILNGESETILDVTFEQLENELPLAVNIHKSVEEAGVYTACGDLVFE